MAIALPRSGLRDDDRRSDQHVGNRAAKRSSDTSVPGGAIQEQEGPIGAVLSRVPREGPVDLWARGPVHPWTCAPVHPSFVR